MSKRGATSDFLTDYLKHLISIYSFLMLVFFPLYIPEGYTDLGVHKYKLFFGFTIVFLLMAIPLTVFAYISRKKENAFDTHSEVNGSNARIPLCFMILYGIACTLSFAFAINRHDSFWGIGGWNMGYLTQLMMLFVFLIFSYAGPSFYQIISFGLLGSVIVYIIGILNRFLIYPLKVGFATAEFISTIGQTNWFCGYMTIFVSIAIGLLLNSENSFIDGIKHFSLIDCFKKNQQTENSRINTAILWIYIFVSFITLWIQGSDSIFFAMFIVFFVAFVIAVRARNSLLKFFAVLTCFGFTAEIDYLLIYVVFPGRFFFLEENDLANTLIRSHVGLAIGAASLLIYLLIWFLTRSKKEENNWSIKAANVISILSVMIMLFSIITGIVLMYLVTTRREEMGALYNIRLLRFNRSWGTGRGLIWKSTLRGYLQATPLQKIFGVGISCLYEYLYGLEDIGRKLTKYYGELVFINAHNEPLNLLLETGIFGVFTYFGFYISSFVLMIRSAIFHNNKISVAKISESNRRAVFISETAGYYALPVLLCISGHFANSLFSFQQITSTPFVVMIVGTYLSCFWTNKSR